ncbi:protease, partial [candidate division KSB1 bacterium]
QNNPVRIIDLKSLEVQKLPWDGSNDNTPVWIGNKIYFLSDRDFCMNVWSYDLNTKELVQNTHFKEFDCKSLESGKEKLIFENGGYLYVFNPEHGEARKLSVSVHGDFPWARPHYEKVDKMIANYAISPTGKRAVFEARG